MLKENKNTRLKSALLGQNSGIFSFAIGTAENPMGNKLSKAENLDLRKRFEKVLKDGGFLYTPIIGKYGNVEKSYIIYNIDLNFSKQLFGKYFNQESFVWARKDTKGMRFEYWQKTENSDYKLIDTQFHISNEKEANDFFSRLKDYKFRISFEFEEDIDDSFLDNMIKLNEEDKVFIEQYVDGKKAGYSAYLHRLYINSKKFD